MSMDRAFMVSIALMVACGDSAGGTSITDATVSTSSSSTTSSATTGVTDAGTITSPTTGTTGEGVSGSTTTSTGPAPTTSTGGDTSSTGDSSTTDDGTTGESEVQCPPPLPPGADCADDGPMQLALIDGATETGALAVDATHVYFTTYAGFDDRLFRVPKCGGEVEMLAPAGQNPSDVLVDDEFVYIADYVAPGRIVRVPKTGGEPIPVVTDLDHPLRMIARGPDLMFGSAFVPGIFTVPKDGGAAVLTHDIGTDTAVYLATDGAFVYWVHDDAFPGRVGRAPLAGGPAETVVAFDDPGALAVTCEHVYVTDIFGRLQRAPSAGGGPLEMVAPSAYRVVASDTHVYGSDSNDQFVYRVPVAGGPPEMIAEAAGTPYLLAVDTQRVYWSDVDVPVIMSAPR